MGVSKVYVVKRDSGGRLPSDGNPIGVCNSEEKANLVFDSFSRNTIYGRADIEEFEMNDFDCLREPPDSPEFY